MSDEYCSDLPKLTFKLLYQEGYEDPQVTLIIEAEGREVGCIGNDELCALALALRNAERYEKAKSLVGDVPKGEFEKALVNNAEAWGLIGDIEFSFGEAPWLNGKS